MSMTFVSDSHPSRSLSQRQRRWRATSWKSRTVFGGSFSGLPVPQLQKERGQADGGGVEKEEGEQLKDATELCVLVRCGGTTT